MQQTPLTQQALIHQHDDNDLIRTRVFPLVGSSTQMGYNPIIPHCCLSEAAENVTMVRELSPLYMYTKGSQLADCAPSIRMNGITNNTQPLQNVVPSASDIYMQEKMYQHFQREREMKVLTETLDEGFVCVMNLMDGINCINLDDDQSKKNSSNV